MSKDERALVMLPPPEIEPVTEQWIQKNTVDWSPALYRRHKNNAAMVSCWQCGIAQGVNIAKRRDPRAWFVIVRGTQIHERRACEYQEQRLRLLTTPEFFDTREAAIREHDSRRAKMLASAYNTHDDPMIRHIQATRPRYDDANDNKNCISTLASPHPPSFSNSSVVIIMQPLFVAQMPSVYVWRDLATSSLRAFRMLSADIHEVALPQRTIDHVAAVLRHFPSTYVLVCELVERTMTLFIYDVYDAAAASTTTLYDRLQRLRDSVNAERRDTNKCTVDLTPLQIVTDESMWRQHLRIYCSSMHMAAVLSRQR
jgi:hypothetical protein